MDHADLEDNLKRLARILPRDASTATEERILLAIRGRRRKVRNLWPYYWAAAACITFLLGWMLGHRSPEPAQFSSAAGAAYVVPADFVELPYAQSGVPVEDVVIVQIELPAGQLDGLGVPLPRLKSGQRLNAEFLVAQDGVPRAVRFVH